jgi:hypothetical protein
LATLAGRRWGSIATGLVAGLPIVAGPILLFYALQQGPLFAGQAALATLLGIISVTLFLLIFAWRAWFGGTALSCLLLGWLGFAASTAAIDRMLDAHRATLLKALVYALAALYLGRKSLPKAEGAPLVDGAVAAQAPAAGAWDIPLRMAAAALLVLALTAMARGLGPRLGGLLTPFPVASSVLAVFSLRLGGREAVRAVLKGFLMAFNAFAVFCAVLAASLPVLGLGPSFGLALAAAGVTHAFVLRRALKSPNH